MMVSSNVNIFSVTGLLCREFTSQRPMTRSFDIFFDLRLTNGWVNNPNSGDLRRHGAHYAGIVMKYNQPTFFTAVTIISWCRNLIAKFSLQLDIPWPIIICLTFGDRPSSYELFHLHWHDRIMVQWNLSITTTSIIKFIPCDLFSNVF